jgi:hypothetical protein
MYINVVNGRKMIPNTGQIQEPLKAALTNPGRAIQMKISAKRGNAPAKIANKQAMFFSPITYSNMVDLLETIEWFPRYGWHNALSTYVDHLANTPATTRNNQAFQ